MINLKHRRLTIIPNKVFLYLLFGYLPVLLIVTNLFIPERFSGYNIGPLILVRPNVFNQDKCLTYHELIHSYQFYRNPITYCLGRWLKYFRFILPRKIVIWSERKTAEFECEAYANQIKCYKKEGYITNPQYFIDEFSMFVYKKYNIKLLDYDTIRSILLYFYNKE
jgi:hypothetical protein